VESIDISANQLSTIDFNEFEMNSKLIFLNVGYNQITDIKPIRNSTTINITNLEIHDNNLTNISELCKLTKLKVLVLSRNRRLDFNKVTFNCWSDLSELFLAETNLKHLNHDYQVLNDCNQLKYLNLMDNNLEMMCFERFPVLPSLEKLIIRNNGLTSLNAEQLKQKFKSLKNITVSGNKWSCNYYNNLTIQLKKLSINVVPMKRFSNEEKCLDKSVIPVECPKAEHNSTNSTQNQVDENIQDIKVGSLSVVLWILMVLDCVFSLLSWRCLYVTIYNSFQT
jgi:Leucine-rich repeat (LRR) protein